MEILTASWVLPVTRPPIRDGRVAVDGGQVAWVGGAGDPASPRGAGATWGRESCCPAW